jgi:hypothetical protein
MRKLLTIAMVLFVGSGFAQNLQVHYDFTEDRNYVTTTLEMFKPDKLGNTFFFVDMDYSTEGNEGMSLAYWEIARVIKPAKLPIGFHAEYNSGFLRLPAFGDASARINAAWLAGIDYSYNAKDFSKGFTVKALYKYINDKHDASFQLTGIWYYHFLKGNKVTFSGFADFWREDNLFGEYIFLCEPQLWYNINKNFSVGGEVELSNNFGGMDGFKVFPTGAVKWTF